MLNEIINQIKNLLSQIPDLKVYDSEVVAIEQYPAVVITGAGFNDTYLTIRRIKRVYTVNLKVYNYVENYEDIKSSLEKLNNIVEAITEKLNQANNISLNGLVDFSLLSVGDYQIVERNGFLLSYNINLKLNKALTI